MIVGKYCFKRLSFLAVNSLDKIIPNCYIIDTAVDSIVKHLLPPTASLSNRTSSVLSEAESDFIRGSIIVQSPNLPVIIERKEMDQKFSSLDEDDVFEDEIEEESAFRTTATQSVSTMKVNPGAIDDN